MNKTELVLSIGIAVTSQVAFAAELQPGDRLTIDEGSSSTLFGVDTISLIGENGLRVGLSLGDTGTGSHNGSPDPDDIGAVTKPWSYFGNTGYEYLSTTTGSGLFGGSTESGVDMSSWTATWNGIPAMILGGCFQLPDGCDSSMNDTGVGAPYLIRSKYLY